MVLKSKMTVIGSFSPVFLNLKWLTLNFAKINANTIKKLKKRKYFYIELFYFFNLNFKHVLSHLMLYH